MDYQFKIACRNRLRFRMPRTIITDFYGNYLQEFFVTATLEMQKIL
jgi:hypothetical protein